MDLFLVALGIFALVLAPLFGGLIQTVLKDPRLHDLWWIHTGIMKIHEYAPWHTVELSEGHHQSSYIIHHIISRSMKPV
jgi:hypothetical protein